MVATTDADTLTGTTENDVITPLAGSDTIDGAGGRDTVVLAGVMADYTISKDTTSGEVSVSDGTDTNVLTAVEVLQFDDAVVDISSLADTEGVLANTHTSNNQDEPVITPLSNGGFVVVWTSNYQDYSSTDGVYGQVFDTNGEKVGSEFRVNTLTNGHQNSPDVAALDDGGFVITYDYNEIYAQRYTADGVTLGDHLTVNTYVSYTQYSPSVTVLSDGDYLFTYTSDRGTYDYIYGQRYHAGMKLGSEFKISSSSSVKEYESDVVALADGGYVVSWHVSGIDGSNNGVFGQVFDASNTKVGDQFQINTTTNLSQSYAKMEATSDGGFIAVWMSQGQDELSETTSYGIYMQKYDSDGAPIGAEVIVNTATIGSQVYPAITELLDGSFIVAWAGPSVVGGDSDIIVQKYTADASKIGGEVVVNGYVTDTQTSPTISAMNDGGFIVGWASNGQDTSGYGVYFERFDKDGVNITGLDIQGDASAQTLTGSEYSDRLLGDAGDDTLDGAAGPDLLIGGLGNDTYLVDNELDVVKELAAEGTDTIRSSVTIAAPENVEHLELTGVDHIDATGNALDNNLTGNVGNNLINGGAGADTMSGGGGDDTYVVDNALDQIVELDGEGVDRVESSVDYVLANTLETLTLIGDQAIDATGNDHDNVLTGNIASNFITGGAGNDVIDGDAGNDTMSGGLGDDRYFVDDINDQVVEQLNSGTDHVQSSVSYALSENVENLTLTGTENLSATGNSLDNHIIGNEGDNIIVVGAGSDVVDGGEGDDVVYFTGDFGDYSITKGASGQIVVSNDSDSNTLSDVEKLSFRDGELIVGAHSLEDTVINTITDGNPTIKSISLSNGNIAIAWAENKADGSEWGVFTQVIGLNGQAISEKKQVNTYTTQSQDSPSIAAGPNGDYAIVWSSNEQHYKYNDYKSTMLRLFDSDGAAVSEEIAVYMSASSRSYPAANIVSTEDGYLIQSSSSYNKLYDFDGSYTKSVSTVSPELVALAKGGYVSVYSYSGADGDGYGVRVRISGEDFSGVGSFIDVNTYTVGSQLEGQVAALQDGGFVVVWTSLYQDGTESSIYGQRFDFRAQKIGEEFLVNKFPLGAQNSPDVLGLKGGGFVVTWVSNGQDGYSDGIIGLAFDSEGRVVGDEFLINSITVGNQNDQELIALADGGFAVIWKSYGTAASYNICYKAFDEYGFNISGIEYISNDTADKLLGTHLQDKIIGSHNDQRIDGGEGADLMIGGTGNDTYIVDNTGDTVVEHKNEGIDKVISSIDYTLADTLENLELTGTQNLVAEGNAKSNQITGNDGDNVIKALDGNDFIDGGLGQDHMYGGLGDDTYIVDNARDLAIEYQGQGHDTVHASVDYILDYTLEDLHLSGAGNIYGTGNSKDNVITGNAGDNILHGKGGSDQVSGGFGNDTIYGDGDDVLHGDAGSDTLIGADSVQMYGGYGNDSLQVSGAGSQVNGGLGADTFTYDQAHGEHVISDFSFGDSVELADLSAIDSLSAVNGSQVQQGQVQYRVDGADTVLFIGSNIVAGADQTIRLLGYSTPDDLQIQGNALVTNHSPVMLTTSMSQASAGKDFKFNFRAQDADVGSNLHFSAKDLPSWLSLDAATGQLTGKASAAHVGNHKIDIAVADGLGASVNKQFDFTVVAADAAPLVASAGMVGFGVNGKSLVGAKVHTKANDGSTMHTLTTAENGKVELVSSIGKAKASAEISAADLAEAINISDAVLALRYIVDLDELSTSQKVAADVNGDGHVNISDVVRILRHIVDLDPITEAKVVETNDLVDHALTMENLTITNGIVSFDVYADFTGLVDDTGIQAISGIEFDVSASGAGTDSFTFNWTSSLTGNNYLNLDNNGSVVVGYTDDIVSESLLKTQVGTMSFAVSLTQEPISISLVGKVTDVVNGEEVIRLVDNGLYITDQGEAVDLIDFDNQNLDLSVVVTGDITQSLTELSVAEII